MKKTLLIAAAALAAGIISSQAQPVYSQNVVGYVNQVMVGGGVFNMVCNPLSNGTNNAEQLISSMTGGELIYLWNTSGGGYYTYSYLGQNSGLTYNWVDAGGVPIPNAALDTSVPPPVIPPGTAFFYTCAAKQTNTWTGVVVLTNSVHLLGGGVFNMVSSSLAVGGPLEFTNVVGGAVNTNINAVLQGGDLVYLWNNNGGGYFTYSYLGLNSGLTYNWVDAGGVPIPGAAPDTSVPPPVLNVGQGMFYTTASATNWVQNLILQ